MNHHTEFRKMSLPQEFIIANPLYDVVFKRLMEDTENARFFIKTLLDCEVTDIQFKPQEYTLPKNLQDVHFPGAITMLRLDFAATIKNAKGEYQKVLIEVQKAKRSMDAMRFRNYLAEHYKRAEDIVQPDGSLQPTPLHIITIYILGFSLPHLTTPAVKIDREYIDLLTKKPLAEREEFIEQLTHDCIIIQTPLIESSVKTELEALLSIFEQRYFIDRSGHLKKYSLPLENENVRRMMLALTYIGASEEGRHDMEVEESVRRIVEGEFDEEMQEIRVELRKKNRQLAEQSEQIAEQSEQLAEQAKLIAELQARLAEERK